MLRPGTPFDKAAAGEDEEVTGFAPPAAPAPALAPAQRYRGRRRLQTTIYGDLIEAKDVARRGGARVVAKRSLLSLVRAGVSRNGKAVLEDPLGEARLLRSLPPHPNVVGFVGEHTEAVALPGGGADLRHWLVLEHVDGGELFDVVDRTEGAGLAAPVARRFFTGLARGLQHLHHHGVAHLDVSLENTLLDTRTSEAVLCDFGLAQAAGNGRRIAFPAGVRPGKDTYMAPEIFEQHPDVDPLAADVWSLGVTLFMMVAGTPPFERPAADDRRFELVVTGRVAHLAAAWGMAARFDECLCDLLSRMLCPADRRATIDEVLAHPWVVGACPAKAA